MPSSRDSFRRNRVAPHIYFNTSEGEKVGSSGRKAQGPQAKFCRFEGMGRALARYVTRTAHSRDFVVN